MVVKYDILENFRTAIFLPFNNMVEKGYYRKCPYKQWRNLDSWSKELKYDEMRIARDISRKPNPDGSYTNIPQWFVGPSDRNRVVPNPEVFDIDDGSFGEYLERMFETQALKPHALTDEEIAKKIEDYCTEREKENNKMKFNFDFGPVDSSVRMSPYGMAIKNASGSYVAYDAKSKQVMDVDIFNFDGANKFIYKMPVAFKDIAVGDVVVHSRKPMFVLEKRGESRLSVLDIFDGEEKTIVLTKSPFNFDFITKVVSLFDLSGSADASNPFGNMLPLLMMGENNDPNALMMYMMMSGNANFTSNPLMMYALMGKDNDMLPFLLMTQSIAPAESK